MFTGKKRIYISNCSGLGNRLETLLLATMIEDRFGHEIFIDWPENESLRIAGTRVGGIPVWDRLVSTKVRDLDELQFEALSGLNVISLRGTYGPREMQKRYLLPTAARLKPHPSIGLKIREAFAPYGKRPAVGVHIRQGDFDVADDVYDANSTRHPSPGIWWFEHVMEAYSKRFPDVYFVLGYCGHVSILESLKSRFDIVMLPKLFEYKTLLPGHLSEGHPVVDMFALACCTTIIATPTSSFSHWATNVLGPQSTCVLPPPRMDRGNPAFSTGNLSGCVLLDWREAAERGEKMCLVHDSDEICLPSAPDADWL